MAESGVSEPASAKLNLYLRVLGRRLDGFHDIDTLVQPLTLADGIRAEPGEGLRLAITGERPGDVPRGQDNLVLKAARALRDATGIDVGATVLLVKRIPVAAGLGGGSADAAATLRALNDVWGCSLARDALMELGASVGSDVPALVPGGPVRARGRGELVEPVTVPRTWWAVVVPGPGIGASEGYAWWDQDGGETGPDPADLLASLNSGDVGAAAPLLFNDLEAPVIQRRPDVARARDALLDAGALAALMCGSGPAVAGLARDGVHAEEVARAVDGIAVGSIVRPPRRGRDDPARDNGSVFTGPGWSNGMTRAFGA